MPEDDELLGLAVKGIEYLNARHGDGIFTLLYRLRTWCETERRWIGWTMAAYGVCVAIATVYGRYHYVVDVAAGAAVSFTGPLLFAYRKSRGA